MKKLIPLFIPVFLAYLLHIKQLPPNVLSYSDSNTVKVEEIQDNSEYWFLLKRKSDIEILYHGVPGEINKSQIIKSFIVKTGEYRKKPTPLPQLLGREYWLITDKFEIKEDEDIGPHFLKLDIPYAEDPPYGPVPYEECDGQCDWELPGSFGLHGVSGDTSKLAIDEKGSSGCIRHSDKDITYLYYLLDPEEKPIRYYIKDI